ncbi:hypothetical protein [Prosthecobacter sp.]|uniref:hypothetical protein n=1 Tax=Prosthecobacter sp. TaxID=1965333 RepID=UPI002ABA850F|nr:hypothetical protein [Prosthecobacter sp.]MDZ4401217.1 hypothetical protein [Prosthecobacter sp.]
MAPLLGQNPNLLALIAEPSRLSGESLVSIAESFGMEPASGGPKSGLFSAYLGYGCFPAAPARRMSRFAHIDKGVERRDGLHGTLGLHDGTALRFSAGKQAPQ